MKALSVHLKAAILVAAFAANAHAGELFDPSYGDGSGSMSGGRHDGVRQPQGLIANLQPGAENRGSRPAGDPSFFNGMLAPSAGGGNVINPTNGHFLQRAAGGFVDSRTGQFLPTSGRGPLQ
jgi:hypothetical protein